MYLTTKNDSLFAAGISLDKKLKKTRAERYNLLVLGHFFRLHLHYQKDSRKIIFTESAAPFMKFPTVVIANMEYFKS